MKNVMMMIGLMLLGTATYAQRGGGSNATPEMRAQRQTTRMTEQLGLDADQQKKVYALELTRVQKMQEMREAQDKSQDARQRMRSANDDYQKSLTELLTADQKTKYQTMQAELREGRGQGRGEMPSDSTKTRSKRSRGPRK